jgi:hypothetical protein
LRFKDVKDLAITVIDFPGICRYHVNVRISNFDVRLRQVRGVRLCLEE